MSAIEHLEITTPSEHERELTITLGSSLVTKEFDSTVVNVQKVATRPGFRPGKLPKNMVMNFFGAEIKQKLVEKLIKKTFENACKENDLIPVSEPKLEPIGEPSQDKSFTYRAIFQVKPKIEVNHYQNLAVKLKKFTFTESDIDDEIRSLQESMATFVEPTDRQEIGLFDLVQCTSVVSVDGTFAPEFSHKDYAVPLFAENVPADLRNALVGKKVGDQATVNYTLPNDHQDEAIQGKECEMRLTIISFKERVLPPINDDLAKDLSDQFDSMDKLRESIRLRFSITAKRREEYYRQDAITKALVEKNPFDVPSALVERMALTLINRELETMGKKVADDLVKNHWQEMWKSVQDRAHFRVKVELILEALVTKLAIDVCDQDLQAKVAKTKDLNNEDARYAVQVEKLMVALEKDALVSVDEVPLFNKG